MPAELTSAPEEGAAGCAYPRRGDTVNHKSNDDDEIQVQRK